MLSPIHHARYDANGNLIWRDDNAGQETCYSIDSLNRVTQKVYFGGSVDAGANGNCGGIPSTNLLSTPSVAYTYGSASGTYSVGRLIQVSNSNSTTNYTAYDALGRVSASNQQTASQTYPFSYGYNLAGSLTVETYPSGRTVATSYDTANRASQVSGSFGGQPKTYVSGVSYAPHGGFSAHSYGNGIATLYAYNARLQQTERTDTLSSSANCGGASNAQYTGQNQFLMDLAFFWGGSATQTTGNNGSLMSELNQTCVAGVANNQYETFSYDGVDRLTQFTDNGGGQSAQAMVYDRYGNMALDLGNSSGTLPVSAQTPGPGQFDPATNRLTTAGAAYDGVGNLMAVGSPALTASYDAENRQVAAGYGAQTTYGYDGTGQRVSKASAGVTTVFVYDAQGQMAAEYSTVAATSPCRTCYLSWDHLGSTRMVTDQNGTVVARHDYLPFGEEILSGYAGRTNLWGGTDNVNQKFTGKERDAESGLDYFGARYYGSAIGRFTSPDPIFFQKEMPRDPQRFNLYAYVRNSPLQLFDPTGEVIQLSGETDAERKKQLAAIQSAVGDKATVGIQQDKYGNYNVSISGDTTKGAAKDFASIIGNSEIAKFSLVSKYETLPTDGRSLSQNNAVGEAGRDSRGQLRIYVQEEPIPNVDGSKFDFSNSGLGTSAFDRIFGVPADTGTETGHEFGHALYLMNIGRAGSFDRTKSDQAALDLENKVRQNRDPAAPVRTVH